MLTSLKAELRKLLSVRSTYFIFGISLVLVALFVGYGNGFRAELPSLRSPDLYMHNAGSAVMLVGLILAFAGLLLLGHEYRYNTIMYTLTSSPNRLRSLVAKIVVITGFAITTSLAVAFFALLCLLAGTHLHHYHAVAQHIAYWPLIWHSAFVGWGYAMYALILIAILRNQVGAIVTFLLIPLIGENILGAIFKHSSKYFPFTSLQAVVGHGGEQLQGTFSPDRSALVALVYIAVGLAASIALFIRRDANKP